MTDVKIASIDVVKQTYEEMDDPSCRAVRDKLIAAGYTAVPSFKTISKWAKVGKWKKKPRTGKKVTAQSGKLKRKLDAAIPVLTGDPRSKAEDVVEAVMKALPPPDPKPEEPKAEQQQEAPPDPEKQAQQDEADARARLKALRDTITGEISDQVLLSEAARQTLRTGIIIEAILGEMAPTLVRLNPEAVGKLHLATAEAIEHASKPLAAPGDKPPMKTVGGNGAMEGEIIPPGEEDPVADAIAAFKRNAAA